MAEVFVSGAFHDLRSRDVRFLQEAARLGELTVLLWSDECFIREEKRQPEFPQAERRYILESLRYVRRVELVDALLEPGRLPARSVPGSSLLAVTEADDSPTWRAFSRSVGLDSRFIPDSQLAGFPSSGDSLPAPGRKKVIVTGCYDWLHSGHMRFFEQAAGYGDLYVSLGNDANIRQLKGDGHPLLCEADRRYMVAAVRSVAHAFVARGFGYLDAAAEIESLRPDIYLVNQDGDRPEKRDFCAAHGLEYMVLQRLPKEGLPRRESTHLRGF